MQQRKRRQHAGMAARARGDRDQAVGAFLDGLAREGVVDDVVQHDAAIGVHGIVDFLARAQRGDDDGHLVAHAQFQVVIEPVIGLVHDLVDRERRRRAVRMLGIVLGQLGGDAVQPVIEHRARARIERREGADHAGLALGDHQVGVGDDEQRRANHRQRKTVLENGGK